MNAAKLVSGPVSIKRRVTLFAMAQMECEHFASLPKSDPAALSDCLGDLEASLEIHGQRDDLALRGLHRRAVAVANMSLGVGCIPCAERVIGIAEAALAELKDAPHERRDTLSVRGKLAHARGDLLQARAAFQSGVELWDTLGRRDSAYFEQLGNAAVIAVDEGRTDLAVELVLLREAALTGAVCSEREAYAGTIDRLVEALAGSPDRSLDDLQRAAAFARRPCP